MSRFDDGVTLRQLLDRAREVVMVDMLALIASLEQIGPAKGNENGGAART